VLTAALSQANLFGHGYGVNLSADFGGRSTRFFLSFSDPYFLDSTFSLGATLFITDINFDSFEQQQRGFDINLGHSLNEDNTARGFVRYSYATRKIQQDSGVNASAPIFREILQGDESSSVLGFSYRSDTRDDRFSPTSGTTYGFNVDYAGLGGFANFLRMEARSQWYLGAPKWMIDRSSFVVGARIGYVAPFNSISDYDLQVNTSGCTGDVQCTNVDNLEDIDDDIKLPLSERYFLGGLGAFQLRGFKSRSVGPRRPILKRSGLTGQGDLFSPVGTELRQDPNFGLEAVCDDRSDSGNQGNGNGRCNSLGDKDLSDFDDVKETDVIGGNKFFTTNFEYRFPISQEIGLQGVLFVDMGGAFYEGQSMFDTSEWRYGTGGGVLWFSPFGPLQLVLGFPIDPEEFEDSPVFEFSVGAFGS
jgi:outer membrane protein assembly factor BamA